jgi:DNA (cytosine-5)-methyltransferase 1
VTAYYNEWDKRCAEWLRNLVSAGLIPAGEVDDRDVMDVRPGDLRGFTQCHFFAGIGAWSGAFRLAGVGDNFSVWTASCPCQPFSQAGDGAGFADERHLWPALHWLIQNCRPQRVIGEQVAGRAGLTWLDLVSADLDGLEYTVRAADLPAASVGAPHRRQRLFWMADANINGRGPTRRSVAQAGDGESQRCGELSGLGYANGPRLSYAESPELRGTRWNDQGRATEQSGGPLDPWRELEWIACADGKARPSQSGIFPLAVRHPGDVAKLRAYGNSICVPLAAEVIKAWLDVTP